MHLCAAQTKQVPQANTQQSMTSASEQWLHQRRHQRVKPAKVQTYKTCSTKFRNWKTLRGFNTSWKKLIDSLNASRAKSLGPTWLPFAKLSRCPTGKDGLWESLRSTTPLWTRWCLTESRWTWLIWSRSSTWKWKNSSGALMQRKSDTSN